MCARDGGVEITIDGNIADRVFPKDGKPVWSEEDEENYQHACFAIRNACRSVGLYTLEDKKDLEDWLNSLKQKIKKGG